MDRRRGRPAATLQDVQGKSISIAFQGNAQRRRRRLPGSLGRTKERDEGAARFRGHGKAPQLVVARVAEPCQQRMARIGAQHLLRRP